MFRSGVLSKTAVVRSVLVVAAIGALLAITDRPVAAVPDYVDDGGFEAGRFADIWKGGSSNPSVGIPICSTNICGDSLGTAAPRSGFFWAWFGGAQTQFDKANLSQNVKFPSGGAAKLRFYLWIGDSSPDGKDSLKVFIDGQRIFTVKESSTKYGTYKLVEKDVSQFADGAKHKLVFKSMCTGDGNTNFNVDDVSIMVN